MTETRTLHVERSTSTAHRLSRYEGVCGNIHGHNMDWDVTVTVDMSHAGDDNMPLDLKDVSDKIDAVDHALILSQDDVLLESLLPDHHSAFNNVSGSDFVGQFGVEELGPVWVFTGDPTCEVLAQWMADRIRNIPAVTQVEITVNETSKYGIETSSGQ